MIEAGVVVDKSGDALFWHHPDGRSGGSLPDSRTLWQALWDAFQAGTLRGFAHSHPGSGVPGPSYTDVTTFAAIEDALGRLDWWIVSEDRVVLLRWAGPDRLSYRSTILTEVPSWIVELRRLSQYEGHGQ